jgi:hypothetical protein
MVMASAVSALTRLIIEPVTTISCNSGAEVSAVVGPAVVDVVVVVVVDALVVDALVVDALVVDALVVDALAADALVVDALVVDALAAVALVADALAAVAVAAVAMATSAASGRRANLCLFLIVELLDIDAAPLNDVAIDGGCARGCTPVTAVQSLTQIDHPISERCFYTTSSGCMNATIALLFIKSSHTAVVSYPHCGCGLSTSRLWRNSAPYRP